MVHKTLATEPLVTNFRSLVSNIFEQLGVFELAPKESDPNELGFEK